MVRWVVGSILHGTGCWLEVEHPVPWRIDPTTHRTMSERSYRGATSHCPFILHVPAQSGMAVLEEDARIWLEVEHPVPWRIDPTTHRTMSERSYRGATSHCPFILHVPAQSGMAVLEEDARIWLEVEHPVPAELVVTDAPVLQVLHDDRADAQPVADLLQVNAVTRRYTQNKQTNKHSKLSVKHRC